MRVEPAARGVHGWGYNPARNAEISESVESLRRIDIEHYIDFARKAGDEIVRPAGPPFPDQRGIGGRALAPGEPRAVFIAAREDTATAGGVSEGRLDRFHRSPPNASLPERSQSPTQPA